MISRWARGEATSWELPNTGQNVVSLSLASSSAPPMVVPPVLVSELDAESADLTVERVLKASRKTIAAKPADPIVRDKAVVGVSALLRLKPEVFDLGKQCLAQEATADKSIRLALRDKSTATLTARLQALNKYVSWQGFSLAAWPPTEECIWDFFHYYATSDQPASRASRFMEAVGFLHYSFGGPPWLGKVLGSKRLTGWSNEQTDRLGLRKQAPILKVLTLNILEGWVAQLNMPLDDLIVAGALLLLVSGRLRYSDLDGAFGLHVSDQKWHLTVVKTKTSGLVGDRLPLEVMGPRFLTTDAQWLRSYLDMRSQLQIPFPDFPLFPARTNGVFCKQAGNVGQFNIALQSVLKRANVENAFSFTSHGCKATLLSWMAHWGADPETRSILGYHECKSLVSVRTYSRNIMQGPMNKLETMLCDVRAGKFHPETGFKKPPSSAEALEDISPPVPSPETFWNVDLEDGASGCSPTATWPGEVEPPSDSDSDSDESVDSKASSSALSERTVHWLSKQTMAGCNFDNEPGFAIFRNPNRPHKVHYGRAGDLSRTHCGIKTEGFERLASGQDDDSDLNWCENCLKLSVIH